MNDTNTRRNGHWTAEGPVGDAWAHRGGRSLAVVLLLAVVLRLAFLLPSIGNAERLFTADAQEYVRLGQGFATAYVDGDQEFLDESVRRPPGYPAFLALSLAVLGGPSALSILPLVAVSVATVWLAFVLASRMFGRRAGIWAALLLAVDPVSIVYSSHFQPDALFAFLLLAGGAVWWAATRRPSIWIATAAGLVIALATFARPISLYLPVVLVPLGLVLGRAHLRRALALQLAFLLAFILPVGAWTLRNRSVADVTMFTSIEASNLFYQRAVAAVAREKGITWEQAYREFAAPRLDDPEAARTDPAAQSGNLAGVGIRLLLEHPVGLLKIALRGTVATLAGPGRDPLLARIGEQQPENPGLAGWALVGAAFTLLGLTYAGVILGLIIVVRRRLWAPAAALLAILCYLLVVSAGPEAYARFRLPMMPLFAVLGGFGWCGVTRLRTRRKAARDTEGHDHPDAPHETERAPASHVVPSS